MPLNTGHKLGPYEIVAQIGAGGMGEVYRARDTRLGRDVALKVLPAEVAGDPARRARFEHEARSVAKINHPGIVALFDIGSENGVLYMVTELVDGRTLRAILAEGPLPTRRLIEAGAEIAEAVAAAHSSGFTHRDLKPENVMLTRDGRAKVLDFGLAKTNAKAAAADETLTVATDPGTVMGTAGYMSPEQVRGQDTDTRTDIFSLGAVLYEMAGGKRAFAAASVAETMAAIVKEEPAELAETVPAPLREIVRRCIEKEPSRRFQSMKDLAFALRNTSAGVVTTPSAPAPVIAPTPRPRTTWLAWTIAAVAVAVAYWLYWESLPYEQLRLTPVASDAAAEIGPAFSPDGKSIAYFRAKGPRWQLLLRALDADAPIILADDLEGVDAGVRTTLFWSVDGSRLYFVGSGGLWQVGRSGGEAVRVAQTRAAAAALPGGGILHITGGELRVTSQPGQSSTVAGKAPRYGGAGSPIFSPDGRSLALPDNGGVVHLTSWPQVNWRKLSCGQGLIAARWYSDSRHLACLDINLWVVNWLDTRTGAMAALRTDPSITFSFDLDPQGRRLILSRGEVVGDIVEFGLDGRLTGPLANSSAVEQAASWSPDGKVLVYRRYLSLGIAALERKNIETGATNILVRLPATGSIPYPQVSPDGRRVAYVHDRKIWTVPAEGGEPLAIAPSAGVNIGWSADGNWIYFVDGGVRKVPSQGGGPVAAVEVPNCTPYNLFARAAGLFVPCTGGTTQVIPWTGGPARGLPAVLVDASHDGRTVYVPSGGREVVVVDAATGAEKQKITLQTDALVRSISVHPDGKRIAAWIQQERSDLWMMEGFVRPTLGWRRFLRKWTVDPAPPAATPAPGEE